VLGEYIVPALGDHFVDAITLDDLVQLRDAWLATIIKTKDGRERLTSPVSVNGRIRILKQLLRAAVDELGLDRDPSLRLDAAREGRPGRKSLAADEAAAFLAAVREQRADWYPFFYCLLLAGFRFGELTALKWSDVDEGRGELTIRGAQWKGIDDTTKTDEERTVPLTPEVQAVLRQQREHLLLTQNPSLRLGLVFPAPKGGYMHNTSPVRALRACLKAAGITRRFTIHGLRHTFNNLLRQATPDAIVIRSMTGHADEKMRARYSHVAQDEKRQALTGLTLLIGGGQLVGENVGDFSREPTLNPQLTARNS
jgi:integrase